MKLRVLEDNVASAVSGVGHDAVLAGIDHAVFIGNDSAAGLDRRIIRNVDSRTDKIISGSAIGISTVATGQNGDIAVIDMQLCRLIPVGVQIVAVCAQCAPALGDDHGIVVGNRRCTNRIGGADLAFQEQSRRTSLHGHQVRVRYAIEGGIIDRYDRSETGKESSSSRAFRYHVEMIQLRDSIVRYIQGSAESAHVISADAGQFNIIIIQHNRFRCIQPQIGVAAGTAVVHQFLSDLFNAEGSVIAKCLAEGFPVRIIAAGDIGEVDLLCHQCRIRFTAQHECAGIADHDAVYIVLRDLD